jgi:hypothetical protein
MHVVHHKVEWAAYPFCDVKRSRGLSSSEVLLLASPSPPRSATLIATRQSSPSHLLLDDAPVE